jgi:hypothetical protein
MPKKDGVDDFIMSDYGNWNVAADYAKLKIMKPLYLADEYETIATFGFTEFQDELTISLNVDQIKIRGFKRLIKALLLVINNSKFAIKSKNDKTHIEKLAADLKRYYNIVPLLSTYKVNHKTKTKELVINKERYDKILDDVLEIKSKINEPLNKYDLIFTHKEEFDPKKAKQMIKHGLTTIG